MCTSSSARRFTPFSGDRSRPLGCIGKVLSTMKHLIFWARLVGVISLYRKTDAAGLRNSSVELEVAPEGQFLKISEGDKYAAAYSPADLEFGKDPKSDIVVNWAGNEVSKGIIKHHPKTYDEAAALVRVIKQSKGKIRAMGMVHSWSNLLPDDGQHVLFLDNFKSIVASPNDPFLVTIQAGVLQMELADWADSPERGAARFSYLTQNTLVQGISFVGACQTASHGSGFEAPTPDYITAVTLIDGTGQIRYFDQSSPDLRVVAACLGMCGIVLDVSVRFNPDTSATKVTETKMDYQSLIPPRNIPITESYNPLKAFIEGQGWQGGAINYAPYNSALAQGLALDKNKIDQYHAKDGIWTLAVKNLPGTPVKTTREGLPFWGTQHEPFYDKDLFVPEDWLMNAPGTRMARAVNGDWRLNQRWGQYSPAGGQLVNNQILFMNPPAWSYRTSYSYNTSHAQSTHFLRYLDKITQGLDFEFAFKVDDDFSNIYEAWRVMVEESDNMWRQKNEIPLNLFCAIRWVGASSCPLAHAYGQPGERFAMLEPTSSHGTPGWEEYLQRVMARWVQIRNKKDGSRPKPHWAKWDKDWTPQIVPYIQDVYSHQMDIMRPVILGLDPTGLFRTGFLSYLFNLPY